MGKKYKYILKKYSVDAFGNKKFLENVEEFDNYKSAYSRYLFYDLPNKDESIIYDIIKTIDKKWALDKILKK